MNYTCDFIVLTWNKLDVTKAFVESFLKHTRSFVRVIFVDNNSTDGTREYLLSLKDTGTCRFKIILNEENLGFIRGMNEGLRVSDAPFVCVTNNDLTFTEGWFDDMMAVFNKRPDVGMLNPNSNNLGCSPSAEQSIDGLARQLKVFSAHFTELPYCIGFCMMMRRDCFEKVGVLSEEFVPMFFEDTDYSMRVRKAGFKLGMAKGAYVYHHEHSSMGQLNNETRQEIFNRSQATFIRKWGRTLRVAWVLDSYDELRECLEHGIDIARMGNFVWFYVRYLSKDRNVIFREHHCDEFSDVKFVRYNNSIDLLWKFSIKKKKFDCMITHDPLLEKTLCMMGQHIFDKYQEEDILRLKKEQEVMVSGEQDDFESND